MPKLLSFIQNLSLDITAGALLSSAFVCRVFDVPVSTSMLVGLGIAIWLIYTADHLLDARKVNGIATNPRHRFHQQYAKYIITAAIALFGLGIYNATRLPAATIRLGLILAGLSAVYFVYLALSRTDRHKEFFAAVVYSAGVFTGPVSLLPSWDLLHVITFLQFFFLASVNLLLFPLFEVEMDDSQSMSSIALRQGHKVIIGRSGALLTAIVLLIGLSFAQGYNQQGQQYVFLTMVLVLLLMVLQPAWFRKASRYRLAGDGIFLIPGLALL